jgi:hypothetical protein
MTIANREISYSVNSLGPWYDELISGLGGTISKVPYYAGIPTIAQAAQTPPGQFPNVNYIINSLVPDASQGVLNTITDSSTAKQIQNADVAASNGWFSFSNFFGTDPGTAGKYILLALLAILIVGIGIFAIIEPAAKTAIKTAAEVS